MRRLCVLTLTLLTLTACAEYGPSEAECFNSFAEVSRSNCNFELLGPIGSSRMNRHSARIYFAGLVWLNAPMAFAQGVPTFDAGMFFQRERVLQQGEQDLALQRDRLIQRGRA